MMQKFVGLLLLFLPLACSSSDMSDDKTSKPLQRDRNAEEPRPKAERTTRNVKTNTECQISNGQIRFIDGTTPVTLDEQAAPGHSHRGGAFDEGPRRKASVWPSAFDVDFPAEGCSVTARQLINQGFAQLHGFLNYEAERSFRTAEADDPSCHFAKIGLVLANSVWVGPGERGADFLRHALDIEDTVSSHARAYLTALQHLYSPENEESNNADYCFARSLGELTEEFPDDLDAKALFALSIWFSGSYALVSDSEDTVEKKQSVSRIIDEVLAKNPTHPVHHYKIHLWDQPETAHRALRSADLSGISSPKIAHMWHMSGHIFDKTGYYFDTAKNQEIAARVDHDYMYRLGVLPYELHNHYHNNEWLANSLFQLGAFEKAEQVAGNLLAVPRHPDKNNSMNQNTHAAYGAQRLAEVWLLTDNFAALRAAEASNLFTISELYGEAQEKMVAMLAVAYKEQSLAAFDRFVNEIDRARIAVPEELINAIRHDRWRAAFDLLTGGSGALDLYFAEQALVAEDYAAARYIADHHYTYHIGGWSPGFDINLARVRAEIALADPETKTAERSKALAILFGSKDLLDPHSALGIRIANLEADYPDISPTPIARRPVNRTGESLERFGTLKWRPLPAPALQRQDINGEWFQLADARKKATVLIFSLTDGCALCREQIADLYEAYPDIASEFDIVILTLDPSDVLEDVVNTNRTRFGLRDTSNIRMISLANEGPVPQPFLDFRVYDGFEMSPLHGVFLVDSEGQILFEDISYKAFDDTDFLFREFRRLLSPELRQYR